MITQQHAMTTEDKSILATQMIESQNVVDDGYIETRFGRVRAQRENPIIFRKGLLGMPDKTNFFLADFPLEKFARFKLLQSLDDTNLSFITLPLEVNNSIISRADIEEGCKDLGFNIDHVTILLIVSIHRDAEGIRMSVNARAPLFCDTIRRVADQCVFRNNNYDIRHPLTLASH